MLIKKAELAKKANVAKQTVSTWLGRGKIVQNDQKLIDTENELNKYFLSKKVPILYKKEGKNTPEVEVEVFKDKISAQLFNPVAENTDLKSVYDDIDQLDEQESKNYLKLFCSYNPKYMLIAAQAKKTNNEAALKEIELMERMNEAYTRDIVDDHFLSLLKLFYDNLRQINYNCIDEIIQMVLKSGTDARGEILAMQDNKVCDEIDNTVENFEKIMKEKYPKGARVNLKMVEFDEDS